MRDLVLKYISDLQYLSIEDRIAEINELKKVLHEISPFKNEPVDCVIWLKTDQIIANDYNPNSVAPPEMQLLEVSINNDGYTQPVVTWLDKDRREIIDGFHRSRIAKESNPIRERLNGYMPVVTVNKI